MRRFSLVLLVLVLVLVLAVACRQTSAPPPVAPAVNTSSGSGLEKAAIETGVIADVSLVSPVGLYQMRHEAGRDLLCIAPDSKGILRFGAQAVFGSEQSCSGHGTVRRTGDKLVLRFDGRPRCLIVAQYDGDQIAFPGVVDLACARLCEGRGSLEGVSFPRIASEAAAALRARTREDEPLCEAG